MTEENYIIINCPNCDDDILIYINEINCSIFRHGVIKHTFQQIPPHASKEQCEDYITRDSVYGCAKPFRLKQSHTNAYVAIKCDYI